MIPLPRPPKLASEVSEDPLEKNNRYNQNPNKVKELTELLTTYKNNSKNEVSI